jgi:hypothetical protein
MAKKVDYKIISVADFLRAKPSGELDMEQSKKVFIDLAALSEHGTSHDILLDVREVYTNFTFSHMYEIVAELDRHKKAFSNRIAVMSREDRQLENGEFLQMCAGNRGFRINVFTDFEDAVDWLATDTNVEK